MQGWSHAINYESKEQTHDSDPARVTDGSLALGKGTDYLWASVTSFVKMRMVSSTISEVPSSSKILRTTLLPFSDSTYLGFLVLVSRSNNPAPLSWESVCFHSNLIGGWLCMVGALGCRPISLRDQYFQPSSGCPCCLRMAHRWGPPRVILAAESCVAQGHAHSLPATHSQWPVSARVIQ